MRAFLAALGVVWTLLLGTIAIELRQINSHLAWLSAPMRSIAATAGASTTGAKDETREQRIERRVREIRDASDESAEVLRRTLSPTPADKSPTAQPSRR